MAKAEAKHSRPDGLRAKYRNEWGLALTTVVVVGVTLLFSRDYLNEPGRNLQDILHQTALLGIFALGAAIVIISGGIDLSSGSVIAFSGSICGLVMLALAPVDEYGLRQTTDVGAAAVTIAILVTILVGAMIGTVHAWLITVVRLPPFVATLASLVGLRSLAKIFNQAVTKHLASQSTKVRADDMTFDSLKEWWVAVLVFLVLGGLCWLLMNWTVAGRHIYAMGGNEEAARLSGIRTDRLKWLAYTIGAVTASIAGILYVAKIGAANPSTLAVGYELNAIAAAVVGGCSLQGGVGLIPGVMLGVLFLRVVIDAIAKIVRQNSDDYQGLIVGFLVVMAVAFNELRRQTSTTGLQFFPGWLGLATVAVLALLVGAVTFVFVELSFTHSRLGAPATSGLSALLTLAVLGACKLIQARRDKA